MKKLLSLFALVALFTTMSFSDAKAQSYCSFVDGTNAFECCSDDNYDANKKACDDFTRPAGTIGGGAPNTNPTNGGSSDTSGTIAPTPASSSEALKSCSAIAFDSLLDILIWLKCIIGAAIIPLIFTLAFLYFLWGMVMFIKGADDVKKREESKKFIYWGIIGLTVMVGVWGIIKIVTSTFGLGNTVPQLQTKDNCLTTSKNNPCR